MNDDSLIGQTIGKAARVYPVGRGSVAALLAAGLTLGVLGDALLRAPEDPGLNLAAWIALVAVAAVVLDRRAPTAPRGRHAWLAVGVTFAAALAWRDAPALKLLALGSATLAFALAAHRLSAAWVWQSGVLRYGVALGLGAIHAWVAASLALVEAAVSLPRADAGAGRASGRRQAAAILRGLVIAAPLVGVFGALFVSADAVFADLVARVFRFDLELVASHVVLFAVFAWISTGYLRGFLTGTDLPPAIWSGLGIGGRPGPAARWPALGITEVATALAAIDLLFLAFVVVQFRYLFGTDALVQVTPGLTYADYARRGFFELVAAVALVVPVLLAADWVVDQRVRRHALAFRALAAVLIGLVLAIAASALHRLNLYYASYGLTEARFYATALLVWIGAMLLWLAATVLRGRREPFAAGTLVSGLVAVALLLVVNPDALIARANVARLASASDVVRFDVTYATTLGADAVPVLIEALPALPPDVRCRLARHVLLRWPPDEARSLRAWNWSAARAGHIARRHRTDLETMAASCPR